MDLEAMCTPTFPASFVVFFSLTSDEPSPASRLFGHGFGGSAVRLLEWPPRKIWGESRGFLIAPKNFTRVGGWWP